MGNVLQTEYIPSHHTRVWRPDVPEDEFDTHSINTLGLPGWDVRDLKEAGIVTVGDLTSKTEDQVNDIVGGKCFDPDCRGDLERIIGALERHGLSLSDDSEG